MSIKLFDLHTHSRHSHDSKASIEESIEFARRGGLAGIAITDHCDIEDYDNPSDLDHIRASFAEAQRFKALSGDRLTVFAGVEMGEAIWNLPLSQSFLRELDFDVVIGSVHAVRFGEITRAFSHFDFRTWENSVIDAYVRRYFEEILETLQTTDFDVLAHLTCLFRYLANNPNYRIDLTPNLPQIDEILQLLIQKDRALEVNTSGLRSALGKTMPDRMILERYRAMGGEKICLGSDAHFSSDVGAGLESAMALLRECGFTHTVYYQNRVCHAVPITE